MPGLRSKVVERTTKSHAKTPEKTEHPRNNNKPTNHVDRHKKAARKIKGSLDKECFEEL
jgi:hypothetical protein